MATVEKIDYSLIPVIEVARTLLGQESRERSKGDERHFPDHGGLFVSLKKNKWYCHSAGTGGDAIDLIRFATDCDYKAAFDWLRSNGYEAYLGERQAPKTIVQVYDYVDADGALLCHEPKEPELLLNADRAILVAGGEKDVDNLCALGFTATCNHGGEGKWWSELTPYLKDRRVFILCDNDEQGEKQRSRSKSKVRHEKEP